MEITVDTVISMSELCKEYKVLRIASEKSPARFLIAEFSIMEEI